MDFINKVLTLSASQVDAQLQVVRKLEEKERLLQGTISAAERELSLRTQALDMNKRKVQSSLCVCVRDCTSALCRLFSV